MRYISVAASAIDTGMPFTLDRFIELRPFLFHLTATDNLNRIVEVRVLQPAKELLAIGGWSTPQTAPRRAHKPVEIDGHTVWIRDQRPLHAGHIAFDEGWDLPRFLSHVDAHVFFWPGTELGPIKAGLNHFDTYAHERPALLRVSTRDLFAANPGLEPLFSRYNSGAPRTVNGRKSPRGSRTYRTRDSRGTARRDAGGCVSRYGAAFSITANRRRV